MALNMPSLDFLSQYRNLLRTSIGNIFSQGRIRAIKNFIQIELQHFSKDSFVDGYPYLLTVETGNYCPLNCALCPTGRGDGDVPKGKLSYSDFKNTLEELGDYLIQISLYNWGEPLLNKDIFKMIRTAKSRGITTVLSTTLNPFNEKIRENLVTSGLDVLIVSLDGASQESVEKYQRGNNFKAVLQAMESIVETKERLNSSSPLVQWRYMVNRYNEHEIPKANRISEKLGIVLELSKMSCDMSREIFMDPEEQFENVESWLPENERYSLYDSEKRRRKKILRNDCSNLWRHAVINWDGSVLPCCWVHDPKYSFGNAFKQDFEKIWNNEKYQSARRLISTGENGQPPTICNVCHRNQAMI